MAVCAGFGAADAIGVVDVTVVPWGFVDFALGELKTAVFTKDIVVFDGVLFCCAVFVVVFWAKDIKNK